jgi:hypothetical protein
MDQLPGQHMKDYKSDFLPDESSLTSIVSSSIGLITGAESLQTLLLRPSIQRFGKNARERETLR